MQDKPLTGTPAADTRSPGVRPDATRPDPSAIGTRQPAHGVSQENSSNAMATHPTEVGGTVPTPPRPYRNPDEPRRADSGEPNPIASAPQPDPSAPNTASDPTAPVRPQDPGQRPLP